MKKIILYVIVCSLSLQLHGMFRFFYKDYYQEKINEVEKLQIRAEGLLAKNSTNIMLKSYLDTLQTPITSDNCNQRKKNLKTLLFPCNTNIGQRFITTSQQNMSQESQSWLRPWEWYKKPLQMCININQEVGAIVQDTKDSLQISDGIAMVAGYVVADSLIRRNSDNIWLTLLASPLYVAVPLTALWFKKCRLDMYTVSFANVAGLQQANINLRDDNQYIHANLQESQKQNNRLRNYVTHANKLRRQGNQALHQEQQQNTNLQARVHDIENQNKRLRNQQLQDSLSYEISRRQQKRELQILEQDRIRLQENNLQLSHQLSLTKAQMNYWQTEMDDIPKQQDSIHISTNSDQHIQVMGYPVDASAMLSTVLRKPLLQNIDTSLQVSNQNVSISLKKEYSRLNQPNINQLYPQDQQISTVPVINCSSSTGKNVSDTSQQSILGNLLQQSFVNGGASFAMSALKKLPK